MKARLDFRHASSEGMKAISELHAFVHKCGLERTLVELVKLRASQINGCAQCIDMHTKELRACPLISKSIRLTTSDSFLAW
jgi:alkylhydroperoxidase family enzyme